MYAVKAGEYTVVLPLFYINFSHSQGWLFLLRLNIFYG